MKVQLADHVIWRDLGDEVVILSLANNNYFGLVGAGGQMWRSLAENGSTDRTVEALAGEFDTDAATLRADLEVLVRELEALGLVIVGDDAAPVESKQAGAARVARRPIRNRAAKAARAIKGVASKKRAAKKTRSKKAHARKASSTKSRR